MQTETDDNKKKAIDGQTDSQTDFNRQKKDRPRLISRQINKNTHRQMDRDKNRYTENRARQKDIWIIDRNRQI